MSVSSYSNQLDLVSRHVHPVRAPLWQTGSALALFLLVVCVGLVHRTRADDAPSTQNPPEDLKQLSLEQLGSVEVTTTSKEPEEVWNTPAAIYVITQEDIRRSGATSVPEILRMVPGVEVARIDSDHWSVGIRGFGSEFSKSVLVLIDGRSVYTPLFAGVYWELQNVLLEDVERIEVIRGPGGTIWGANAVNGVINIITKNTKDTHGALAVHLRWQCRSGDREVSASVEGMEKILISACMAWPSAAQQSFTRITPNSTNGRWGRVVSERTGS